MFQYNIVITVHLSRSLAFNDDNNVWIKIKGNRNENSNKNDGINNKNKNQTHCELQTTNCVYG